MSHHTFQYYTFDTDLQPESSDYQNNPEQMLRNLQSQLQSYQQLRSSSVVSTPINLNPLPIIPWVPSTKFLKLLDNFDSSILNQFPCAPCAFCGRLMYPQKCEWLPYDSVVIGTGHVHGRDRTGHVRDMSKKFSNVRDIGTFYIYIF